SPPAIVSPPAPVTVALVSGKHETMTIRAKVETSKQQDMVSQDSLRISRDMITLLQLRAVVAEQHRAEITRQDVKALHARAEAAEQRVEALQASLRDVKINIADLRESRRADGLEMDELQSQAQDIEARLPEIERHFGI
nr:hypothetical protein [Tanacetum cinerariifolium]